MAHFDKLKHAVLGFAVGDAFGMAYECGKRGEFEFYGDKMVGYTKGMPAYFYETDIPAGTWTDDTAMIVAELDSGRNNLYINNGSVCPTTVTDCGGKTQQGNVTMLEFSAESLSLRIFGIHTKKEFYREVFKI